MRKHKKWSLVVLVALLLTSACDSLLDVEADDGRKDDQSYFKTKSDFESYIFGGYTYLAGRGDAEGVAKVVTTSTQAMGDGVDGNGLKTELLSLLGPGGSSSGQLWSDFYNIVTRMNTVLDRLPGSDVASADKVRIEAEAKFLRGFSYSYLARAYGNVPILVEAYNISQASITCSEESKVWEQVINDLSYAATNLPTAKEWGADNRGRASKGAALAYLANAYMYTTEWAKAETEAAKLIALNEYALIDKSKIRDVFSIGTPNNVESIFEVQYRDKDWDWNADRQNGTILPQWTSAVNGGWGAVLANLKLVNAFEPTDLRRTTFLKINGEEMSYYEASMGKFTIKDLSSSIGMSNKYAYNDQDDWMSAQNVPFMRFAEFKLDYAEILFNVNKKTEAYQQLNDVRARAGVSARTFSADSETFMNDLMKERRLELNFETNLWFHFTRTKRAKDFLFSEYGLVMEDRFNKFAIPQTERDQNPNLCQNPGY